MRLAEDFQAVDTFDLYQTPDTRPRMVDESPVYIRPLSQPSYAPSSSPVEGLETVAATLPASIEPTTTAAPQGITVGEQVGPQATPVLSAEALAVLANTAEQNANNAPMTDKVKSWLKTGSNSMYVGGAVLVVVAFIIWLKTK